MDYELFMLRTQRPITTSAELDTLEHDWWNKNSELIASVWEMDESFQKIIRTNYIKDAKVFFGETGKIKIFEPGCGSGWVGQMIASNDISIIGTDYSESQISLSQQNAEKKRLTKFCDYYVHQSNEWPESAKECEGILFHSFLHHLNGQELDSFFDSIKSSFPAGTKVWMFEPCFYTQEKKAEIGGLRKKVERVSQRVVVSTIKLLEKLDLLDKKTLFKFQNLEKQAQDNSYYLSPKEVPFDVEEYRAYLSKFMEIKYEKWAIINLVGWSFHINLVKNKTLRTILGNSVLRFLELSDRYLSKSDAYGMLRMKAPIHGFRIYAGTLK